MNSFYWHIVFKKLCRNVFYSERLGSWNIFSNEGTSTLCKTKSSHSFWICSWYHSAVLILILFYGRWSCCSNEPAKFEKNLQKNICIHFWIKRDHIIIFSWYFILLSPFRRHTSRLKFCQSSLELFLFSVIFSSKVKFFIIMNNFFFEKVLHFEKWPY